jgi:hypothetical protein
MNVNPVCKAKDENLNEKNFQIFAQKAIEKYLEKNMLIDGMLWGQIIKYYNKTLANKLEEIIMERELKFKCLGCGKDLSYDIMNRKIRIHLCTRCRDVYMSRFAQKELAK